MAANPLFTDTAGKIFYSHSTEFHTPQWSSHFLNLMNEWMPALCLRCFPWAFSGCSVWAAACSDSSCGLWAHRLQELLHVGLVVAALRLQSTGSVDVAHGLSCPVACEILLTRDRTCVSHIGRRFLNHRTTREVPILTNIDFCSWNRSTTSWFWNFFNKHFTAHPKSLF